MKPWVAFCLFVSLFLFLLPSVVPGVVEGPRYDVFSVV